MAESETVEMSGQTIEQVHGTIVRLQHSVVNQLHAEQAQLVQSAAQRVEADWVEVQQGVVQLIEAGTVRTRGGLAMAVRGDMIAAEQLGTLALRAEELTLADSFAGLLVGQNIQAGNVNTFIFVGKHVEGQVHTVLDSRGAALLGLALGAVLGTLTLIGGWVGRSRR